MQCTRTAAARVGRAALALALVPLAHACRAPELTQDPWSAWGAGTHTLGASTGWAVYEAEVELTGTSGPLTGQNGSDPTDLEPRWGAALKYQYLLNDNFALGAIVEARTFDPDPVAPLSASIDGDDYTSLHFLLTSRYYFDGLGATKRWRPYIGLDLGYVPEVDIDATVDYSPLPVPSESITLSGDEYWTLSPLVGLQYLLSDRLSLDFGAFYDFALDSTDDTITLTNVGSTVDGEVTPEGLIFFVGVGYAL